MRKYLLILALCACAIAGAQHVTITRNVPLLKDVVKGAYYPVLSNNGRQLLFTGSNEQGLKLYSYDDNVVTTVTEAAYAGAEATVSDEGMVSYVAQATRDKLQYRSALRYDAAKKSAETLIDYTREPIMPVVASNGSGFMRSKKYIAGVKGLKPAKVSVYTHASELIINRNGEEKGYSPAGETAGYLWASLSPDGQKVAFFAAGKGIYIVNLKGEVLSKLGNYEIPRWLNNSYLVAQNAKDDGHQYISSQIMLIKADGSYKKELTPATSMTMQPTVAQGAGKIVYTTIDGNLFEMELTISE